MFTIKALKELRELIRCEKDTCVKEHTRVLLTETLFRKHPIKKAKLEAKIEELEKIERLVTEKLKTAILMAEIEL